MLWNERSYTVSTSCAQYTWVRRSVLDGQKLPEMTVFFSRPSYYTHIYGTNPLRSWTRHIPESGKRLFGVPCEGQGVWRPRERMWLTGQCSEGWPIFASLNWEPKVKVTPTQAAQRHLASRVICKVWHSCWPWQPSELREMRKGITALH